ncbi:MAG TPA: cation-transporting P-type ATPase, partial [Nitrospiraceae bacterium]
MNKDFFQRFSRGSAAESTNLKTPQAHPENERHLRDLCAIPVREAFNTLDTTHRGLTSKEAEHRLDEYGPNELSQAKRLGFWADIFRRCRNPLVVQLLIIALVSAFIGEFKSSVIVGVMILLSVGLSYMLDRRSNRAVESLGKRVQSRTHVLRDGRETEIRISEVVPGDIVLLQAGSIIPADLRLLTTKDFFVSQSVLTGESMAVEKTAEGNSSPGSVAGDLANACFLGTTVTSGTARGLVVHTGTQTLFGAISEKLTEKREETSFDRGVRSFTWLMIRFMVVMVFAVFLIVGLTKGDWLEALLFGLSIAVGLTPEMLPMIVTVNLAKGALTMAKKKV